MSERVNAQTEANKNGKKKIKKEQNILVIDLELEVS